MSDDVDSIVAGARDFFEEAQGHESEWRAKWADELDFRAGKQWSDTAIAARNRPNEPPRPCMVVDQTDQYMRQVVNDARMSPPALRASPVDDKADIRVAEDLQGLFRHIERVSRAQRAYLTALEWGSTIGRGAFRVYSEQVDETRNWWEPRIGRIANALQVYFDPFSTEIDGSDQTDAMLVLTYKPSTFKRRWPRAETTTSWDADWRDQHWCTSEFIRVAEWHSVRDRETKIILLGDQEISEDQARQAVLIDPLAPIRETTRTDKVCTIRHVTARDVLEETEFHAPHVGLIPVYGNDRWTQEGRELFGMVRQAKDAGRLGNYIISGFAEAINNQVKAQWVGPAAAFKGYEAIWAKANTSNRAYLPYHHRDGDRPDDPIPAPTRNSVDLQIAGFVGAIQTSGALIQASLGMYQAAVGAQGPERSGVAIARRKSESDVGTYHYIDNLAGSIAHAGRIIMAMLPKVYDTPRVARILGEDGEPQHVQINPAAPQAFAETQGPAGRMDVLNPTIGQYDIHVSVGPSYASQREETAATLADLYGRSPQLMAATGDIYFENLNFPGAKEIAKRIKATLPNEIKAATDDGGDLPPEIAEKVARVVQTVQQREQLVAAAAEEADKRIAEAKEVTAQARIAAAGADASRARLQAERERMDKEQQAIEHARQMLDRDRAELQRAARLAQADIQRAAQDGARTIGDAAAHKED